MNYSILDEFEAALGAYTGAPHVVLTDCCTHAIELCLRYQAVRRVNFTHRTYLSVPMLMHKLEIAYTYNDDPWYDAGRYQFHGTSIWDSARHLSTNCYRRGTMACLSFGHDKPLALGHGGAILLDDPAAYQMMRAQAYDGREDLSKPWHEQLTYMVGYHYNMRLETAAAGIAKLASYQPRPNNKLYPSLRGLTIV